MQTCKQPDPLPRLEDSPAERLRKWNILLEQDCPPEVSLVFVPRVVDFPMANPTFHVLADIPSHEHKNPSGSTITIRSIRATHYIDWDGTKRPVKKK